MYNFWSKQRNVMGSKLINKMGLFKNIFSTQKVEKDTAKSQNGKNKYSLLFVDTILNFFFYVESFGFACLKGLE